MAATAKKKVYVAGAWADKKSVIEVIEKLKDKCEITRNWTKVTEEEKKIHPLADFAELDLQGVIQAEMVVIVVSLKDYAYRGTTTELGCALGLRKPVYVYEIVEGSKFMDNLFIHHRLIHRIKDLSELPI